MKLFIAAAMFLTYIFNPPKPATLRPVMVLVDNDGANLVRIYCVPLRYAGTQTVYVSGDNDSRRVELSDAHCPEIPR